MRRLALALVVTFTATGCNKAVCADGQQNPCVCTGHVGHPTGTQVCEGGEYGACDCSATEAQLKADAAERGRKVDALREDYLDEAKKAAESVKALADELDALNEKIRTTEMGPEHHKLRAKRSAVEDRLEVAKAVNRTYHGEPEPEPEPGAREPGDDNDDPLEGL